MEALLPKLLLPRLLPKFAEADRKGVHLLDTGELQLQSFLHQAVNHAEKVPRLMSWLDANEHLEAALPAAHLL